jgi:hypothetical protein
MKGESTSNFLRFFACESSTGVVELFVALLVPEESNTIEKENQGSNIPR